MVSVAALMRGQASTTEVVDLPVVEIWSPRVANQEAGATFAAPVTALRFEPAVDVQARNFAEGQADVAIRGGTFANTGFSVGAVSIYDPQTGHYTAEMPLAPAMLRSPEIRTGAGHAIAGGRGTAGSVGFGWRPIVATGGAVGATLGTADTQTGDVYLAASGANGWGADAEVARSRSAGTIDFGDHEFTRGSVRVQHRGIESQTDVALGYHEKFFGWPNLYTPFNSPETENLQQVLLVANHQVQWAGDDELRIGAYYRRNKDDYAFNRFAPVVDPHPFQHTTWVYGAGANGAVAWGPASRVNFGAEVSADELTSTSLVHGRFDSRTHWRLAAYPEHRWSREAGGDVVVTGGVAYEDTNREGAAWLPMIELAREDPSALWSRLAVAYTAASQVPSYTELNSSTTGGLFRGNPDLDRSYAHTLDLRAEGRLGEWMADASVYWRRDDNLVDWVFRRGVTARAGRAVDLDTLGVELFARRSWAAVELLFGYGWLHKEADYGDATIDGSFYALNFPEHRLTAAVVWRALPGVEIRLDNEARLQADNPLRRTGGDEAVISDLGIYWRPRGAPGWLFSLQIDNLWNTNFEEVPATPAADRLVAVGARFAW